MPKAASVQPGHREAWDKLHGDPRDAQVPFRQVWNTYDQVTGSSVICQPTGISTMVVPALPGRRRLTITLDSPTGTPNVYLSEEHPASVHNSILLTGHGANFTMNGVYGIYPGTVNAAHDGNSPVMLLWSQGWTDEPPIT